MTPVELQQRTKQFALRCLKVAEALPKSVTGKAIALQLARASTSVAANYRAACRARSKPDFVSKIAIVEEEADEVAFWLELAVEAGVFPAKKLANLQQEADEIVRIIAASHISASGQRARRFGANQQSAISNQQ